MLKGATVEPSNSLDRLQAGYGARKKSENPQGRRPQHETGKKTHQRNHNSGKSCSRCGKAPHAQDRCPAKEAVCHRCQRKGHFSSQCRTKSLSSISEDTAFLDTLTDQSAVSWQAQIELNGKATQFKLDTGAEVTAISPETYKCLRNVELCKSKKILSGPSRKALKVMGQFQGHFVYKTRTTSQPVYVVDGLKTNLLGLPTITALNLAARIDAFTGGSEQDIQNNLLCCLKVWATLVRSTTFSSSQKLSHLLYILLDMCHYHYETKSRKSLTEWNL